MREEETLLSRRPQSTGPQNLMRASWLGPEPFPVTCLVNSKPAESGHFYHISSTIYLKACFVCRFLSSQISRFTVPLAGSSQNPLRKSDDLAVK